MKGKNQKQNSKPKPKQKREEVNAAVKRELKKMGMVPVAVNKTMTAKPMRINKPLPRGGICVTQREMVGDVTSENNVFAIWSHIINPGNKTLFPWLSRLASGYEFYRFKWIKVVYIPMVPATSTGKIWILYEPDAGDIDVANAQEASAMAIQVANQVHQPTTLHIPGSALNLERKKSRIQAPFPVNSRGNALVDVGKIEIISQVSGFATPPTDLGSIYVEYEVELTEPSSEESGTGGTIVLDGNQSDFSAVSKSISAGSKGIDWNYAAGMYNGPSIATSGSFLVHIKVVVSGGGSVTSWTPKIYGAADGSSLTVIESNVGTTAYLCFLVTLNQQGAQLDVLAGNTGTITGWSTNVRIAEAPEGSLI